MSLYSRDMIYFISCITGPVVGELLDKIIPMLTANMNPEKDAEVRLKLFTLVSRLVQNSAETLNSTNRYEFSPCLSGKKLFNYDVCV